MPSYQLFGRTDTKKPKTRWIFLYEKEYHMLVISRIRVISALRAKGIVFPVGQNLMVALPIDPIDNHVAPPDDTFQANLEIPDVAQGEIQQDAFHEHEPLEVAHIAPQEDPQNDAPVEVEVEDAFNEHEPLEVAHIAPQEDPQNDAPVEVEVAPQAWPVACMKCGNPLHVAVFCDSPNQNKQAVRRAYYAANPEAYQREQARLALKRQQKAQGIYIPRAGPSRRGN